MNIYQLFSKKTISFAQKKWIYFIRKYWIAFFHSMPVRLIAIQLRQHPFLIAGWFFIFGVLNGNIGKGFGAQAQLIEPEYLDEVGFLSFFIVGMALGSFIFSHIITLYINMSYKFHFLVMRRAPFFTFCLNNLPIPAAFFTLYMVLYTRYQMQHYGSFTGETWERLAGLFCGVLLIFFALSGAFFATTKNIFRYFGDSIQREFERQKNIRRLRFLVSKAKDSVRTPYQVDNYLGLIPFGFRKIDHEKTPDLSKVMQVLNQNHGNLLFLQVLFLLLIVSLGYFSAIPAFQIPTGASGLVTISLFIMIGGALTFWVRKMGFLTFLLFFFLVYGYSKIDFLKERHCAPGLNYQVKPTPYTWENIHTLSQNKENPAADHAQTLQMLNNWKVRYQQKYGSERKPKAVFMCTTGGGLRATIWSLTALQALDSLTNGRITDELRLMTGASGGMFGFAYFRELMLKKQKGEISTFMHPQFAANASKDVLNRVFIQAMTDVVFPNQSLTEGKKRYDKEKGWAFDEEVMTHMPEFRGRRLGHYRKWEMQGLIPQMILSPAIANQGKNLYVSALGVSYLANTQQLPGSYTTKLPGIEFRRFFANHDPDSLWFVTALRMNATFPYILPLVSLPSQPEMFVLDAGTIDNFGISTAVKYLYEFREWFAENTESVLLVSVRDTEKEDKIADVKSDNILGQLANPIGGSYYSLMQVGDASMDYMLEGMKDWYKGPVNVISFEYPFNTLKNPAVLSFRLTEYEKKDIPVQLQTPHNQESIKFVKKLYGLR